MKIARHHISAFSLIEMLVVIAIIGILAAIALPGLKNIQGGDVMVAASRQMLDEVARARQLAISQRTTVYMVFCPVGFWADPAYVSLPQAERNKGVSLYDRELEAYTFVTLRSVGEQPGQLSPRYLSAWRTMPDGAFIPPYKFNIRTVPPKPTLIYDPPQPNAGATLRFSIEGFDTTDTLPFPTADAYVPYQKYATLPYIAFNHLGQLTSGQDEFIPLARGKINHARDAVGNPLPPQILESPVGNGTNAFHVIHIEWLTGRARLEKQEVQ